MSWLRAYLDRVIEGEREELRDAGLGEPPRRVLTVDPRALGIEHSDDLTWAEWDDDGVECDPWELRGYVPSWAEPE